jgi:hypothetical protein
VLGGEGAAAAAIAGGIGIDKDESLAHQRVFIVERRAVEVEEALGIDEDAGTKLLKHFVAVAGLGVEPHGVGEAGAAAALDAYTETALIRRHTFFRRAERESSSPHARRRES